MVLINDQMHYSLKLVAPSHCASTRYCLCTTFVHSTYQEKEVCDVCKSACHSCIMVLISMELLFFACGLYLDLFMIKMLTNM